MLISENLTVVGNHLYIGKYDAVALAEKYGTPCYIMDEELIRKNCRTYTDAMEKHYGGRGMIAYASKAFSSKYMYKIAMEEGLGCDVVSGGELYTAHEAGFPMDKVLFHGNNKTDEELGMAMDFGVGHIVCDNTYELERVNKMASERAMVQKIMFRIKPGVEAHTHSFVQTGQIDSKFGVALLGGEAFDIIKSASAMSNVEVDGIHCHIGSQIFDIEPFCEAARLMIGLMGEVKSKLGIELRYLNLGGGFGIVYTEADDPVSYDKYIEKVSKVVYDASEACGINVPEIIMEPGRSIVASAGVTLYTVGTVKDIPGVRKYVSVDGGMADNPRYILYQSEYTALIANKAAEAAADTVTIAGKCCESGDLLAEGIKLQPAEPGDILAVLATGAYNYSMSSNYNRIPRPPVVMLSEDGDKLVVKRETYADLVRNDI